MNKTQLIVGSLLLAFNFILGPTLGANAGAAILDCPTATTLEALAACIVRQMPGRLSNGYQAPNVLERSDWRAVVRDMLNGACDFPLPESLAGNMQLRSFTDDENSKTYCVLMEVLDEDDNGKVDKGWGTFIVDSAAAREIDHQAPHPIFDGDTANQAVGISKATDSRSYLLCGAHRHANGLTGSTCQANYGEADCAHNIDNMFMATTEELNDFYGDTAWTALQWHGMADTTCGSVSAYLSQGFTWLPAEDAKVQVLKRTIRDYHPDWDVRVTGEGGCTLNATDNVQGRFLNGVAAQSACQQTAGEPVGDKFIHNEQKRVFQSAADWVPAVIDVWP